MRDMTADIRAAARTLLGEKKVDVLVGFERGSDGYRARPAFLRSGAAPSA